ncbi:cytochrome P450 [Geodermatophilus normandii]|uniref:Cytochrome P450 n=2 Tax=Geodermatophilus normandii TaxID=1137989 RepID=A0A6P0GNG8_9ACTN|nr:cytochrome P450 [Geodermatophilus normandii]
MTTASVAREIDLIDLARDPYPIYQQLRDTAPVAWVPAANRYLVTRYDDVMAVERDQRVFSSVEQDSLMIRAIGPLALLRQDGEAHQRLRKAAETPVKPRAVKTEWLPKFRQNTEALISAFVDRGKADLVADFAAPLAATNLGTLLGLPDATAADIQEWSQAIIDACGNYADDPAVWARNDRAVQAVDAAITEILPYLREHPDSSVISAMLQAGLNPDEIRTNVKIFIGGGVNEPRDVLAVAAYALLSHPDQLTDVLGGTTPWKAVFEEAVRWVSPIGMYPRQVTEDVELGGVALHAGDRLGVVIASANRDERIFDRPDEFDTRREVKPHLAFGGGPHFCLGTWVARASIGEVGLPTLFDRLPGLTLTDADAVRLHGWVFRGPLSVPVTWRV